VIELHEEVVLGVGRGVGLHILSLLDWTAFATFTYLCPPLDLSSLWHPWRLATVPPAAEFDFQNWGKTINQKHGWGGNVTVFSMKGEKGPGRGALASSTMCCNTIVREMTSIDRGRKHICAEELKPVVLPLVVSLLVAILRRLLPLH